jgi:hypothetical protein
MSLQGACNVSRPSTICRGTTFPYPGSSRERLVSPACTWSAPRFNSGLYQSVRSPGPAWGLTRHARTVLAKPDRALRTDPARPAPAAELLDTTPSTAARHRLRASPPRHSSPHPCPAWPAARTHATRLAGTRRPSPAVQCTTRQRGAGIRVLTGWFVLHHNSASATNGRLDEPRRRDSSLIDRPTVSR